MDCLVASWAHLQDSSTRRPNSRVRHHDDDDAAAAAKSLSHDELFAMLAPNLRWRRAEGCLAESSTAIWVDIVNILGRRSLGGLNLNP